MPSVSLTATESIGKLPLCRGGSMLSGNYRYYRLDGAGYLQNAEWFYADSDNDAITQIEAEHPGDKCEIWQGERLVAKLSSARLRA